MLSSYDLGLCKRWDWLYVRNISSENIDTYNVDALNNITAGDYFIGDGSLLTNVNITGQETDPLWSSNQSSYSTTAEIIGFNYWNDTFATFNKTYADTLYYDLGNSYGYYNSTDFDISDYYLKSNPYSFYNSSDFSISDYFTSLEVEGFNYYNSTDFDISDYYLKSNPYSYINNSLLIDNSIANTLHRHSELVASDGSPDPALSVDANGNVGIGTTAPKGKLQITNSIGFDLSAGDVGTIGQDNILLLNSANGNEEGSYGPGISFGSPGKHQSRRYASIASVQTTVDPDKVGLIFITHPGASSIDDLVEQITNNS